MGSAMTSPARVGQPKMRTPVTKQLAATRSVQGELALGMQKSRLALDIGQSVGKVAMVGLRIKEADETMSASAAASEYNNRMAQWTTNSKLTANELNEDTGLRRWETFDEDFKKESEALKAELRDKYKFSMRKSEDQWTLKTNAVDGSHKENIAVFQNDRTVERAGANYQVAMAGATTFMQAQALTADAVNSGIILEGQGVANMDKWAVGNAFDRALNSVPGMDFNSLKSTSQQAESGDGIFARLTPAQRNTIETATLNQTKSLHAGLMTKAYENNGISGAQEYLRQVTEGGTDASFASNDLNHLKVVGTMGAHLSQLERVTVQKEVGQLSSVSLAPLTGGSAAELDTLAMRVGSKDYKVSKGVMEEQLLEVSGRPDFLKEVQPLAARLAYIGDDSTVINNKLSQNMRSQNPKNVVESLQFMQSIEKQYPTAFSGIKTDIRDRAEYISYRINATGVDPEDPNAINTLNQDYLKIQNMSPEEKTDRNQRATTALANIKKEEGLVEHITAQAVKAGDIPEGEEVLISPDMAGDYQIQYKKGYMFTSDVAFAGDSSYGNFRRTHGIVEFDGDLVMELNPPESVLPRPEGWTAADHREDMNSQRSAIVKNYNTETGAELTNDDVKYHYNGKNKEGKDVWVVTDLGNVALPYGDGNLQVPFEAGHQRMTPKKTNAANTGIANQYTEREEFITAQANIEFIDNGILGLDPGEGTDDAKMTAKLYDHQWGMLHDDEKIDANNAYWAMFNTIKSANQKYGEDKDEMIHWYLFSNGYLRKGEGDNWKRPPGILDGS